jgi:hypothetical protein
VIPVTVWAAMDTNRSHQWFELPIRGHTRAGGSTTCRHGEKSAQMTTAHPARPATVPPAPVRASALAAWQLVEDARTRPERRHRNDRSRVLAQRAVADRRAERELSAS